MAVSFVVADMLADVARTAMVPDFTSTTNITSSQIAYKLAQSARSFSAKLKQRRGVDLDYLNQATLTVQAGVGLTSLPSDCGEVHAVLWQKTSSDWRLLDAAPIDDYEAGQLDELKLWREQCTPHYQLQGNTITFYPASSGAETVTVLYTKHLDVAGETSFFSRADADRWITLDLVIWVLNAQGRHEQAQVYLQEKALLEVDLFSAARNRDPNAVHTIRDTVGRRRDQFFRDRDRWGRY